MKSSTQQKSDFEYRINRARLAGAMHSYTLDEFKNYLLDIGLNKYEKVILPVETEREYPASEQAQGVKIIPFPGVSLPEPDSCQKGLEGFLQEMGYIE
jgi:hypothetical protein